MKVDKPSFFDKKHIVDFEGGNKVVAYGNDNKFQAFIGAVSFYHILFEGLIQGFLRSAAPPQTEYELLGISVSDLNSSHSQAELEQLGIRVGVFIFTGDLKQIYTQEYPLKLKEEESALYAILFEKSMPDELKKGKTHGDFLKGFTVYQSEFKTYFVLIDEKDVEKNLDIIKKIIGAFGIVTDSLGTKEYKELGSAVEVVSSKIKELGIRVIISDLDYFSTDDKRNR